MTNRFDAQDRQQVVSRVEKHLGARLYPIGRRQKHLRDDDGNRYWVFGGYGHWHGIPSEMLDIELSGHGEATLVIAIRKKTTIDVYTGTSSTLVLGRSLLSKGKNGDYKFNVVEGNGRLFIREIPSASLSLLSTIHYSVAQKADDREGFVLRRQLARDFSRLTDSEKEEVLVLLG